MKKYKFLLILFIILIFVTGCSNDKCIKSHKEKETCITYVYIPKPKGGFIMIPTYYSCEKEVCDLYESEELK